MKNNQNNFHDKNHKINVLQNSMYSSVSGDVASTGNYNTKEKIKIYTSETQETGISATGVCGGWWTQNLWGSGGLMLAIDNYELYNGTTIYKITIEAGCQLPCGDTTYVTSKEVTYVNSDFGKESAKNSAFNWTVQIPETPVTKQEISLFDVQMRGALNGWYYYLVLRSDAYNDLAATDGSFSTDNTTFDKIKLFTCEEDTTGTLLSALNVQHVERNFGNWTKGLFINFAEYDSTYGGHQVYKVVIEKGCELLADVSDTSKTVFVVDKTYTFVNTDYGNASAKLGANSWYNETEIDSFVTSYMHMDDEEYAGEGTGACISKNTYQTAKDALLNVATSSDSGTHVRALNAFKNSSRYASSKARYENWARAASDLSPYSEAGVNALNPLSRSSNSNFTAIAITSSVLVASVLASIIVIRKRKHI